jgi:hypothetical protein
MIGSEDHIADRLGLTDLSVMLDTEFVKLKTGRVVAELGVWRRRVVGVPVRRLWYNVKQRAVLAG